MKRRKVVRIAAALICALVVLTATLLLYLNFADLSGWRDTVARLASEAIGRELKIDGTFRPEIGFTTRVVATDVTLANADWSGEPQMVSVDRLAGEIDLLSLLFGPITIHDVEVTGARVLFETNDGGRLNWALGSGETGTGSGGEIELVIEHALLTDAQLVYVPPQGRALEAALTKLEFTDDGTGMLDLDLVGELDESPLDVSGRLGTFIGLINAASLEHQLSGKLGNIEFATTGRIADLATLAGADLTARVGSDDLATVAELLDLPDLPDGAFHTDLTVSPAATGSHIELDASAGDIAADLAGTVDSLVKPRTLDITVAASGADISKIGSLAGVEDLPEEAFTVSGRIHWAGFPLTCDNIEIQVGDNSLRAHGVVGEPPLMLGTDFSFEGGGPDLASIAALAGIPLPRDSFTVAGRLVRLEEGIGVQGVTARIGRSTLEIDGTVGDPPEYAGTVLSISGSGPNLAHFQPLAGVALPAEPFDIDGRLVEGDEAIALENLHARLGPNVFQVEGQLTTKAGFAGTDLRVHGSGPDASQLAAMAEISNVPAEPYRVDGTVRVLERGYRVSGLVGSLGTLGATVDGFVAQPPHLIGSDIEIHLEDSDLSHPASIAGLAGLPRDAFRIASRIRFEESGYRLDGLEASVGDIEFDADGLIGAPPELEKTHIRFSARGPRLSSLNAYLDQTGLPSAPFSVSGSVQVTGGAYTLDGLVAEIDGNRVTLDGTIQPTAGLFGTDVEITVSAPELSQLGRLAAGFADVPALPAEPFALDTRLRIDEMGYQIENLRATLADAKAAVNGRVGAPPKLLGTDLTIDSDGPNASLLTSVTGVTMPVAPVQLNGRVERDESGFRFHRVTARLGEYRAAIDGTLGELPKLIGTDLEIRSSGPGTGLIQELAGVSGFPDRPFQIDGKFKGSPERFASRDFRLVFGPSDIRGSFTVDITGKPAVQAHLTSNITDLSRLREHIETEETVEKQPSAAPASAGPKRLIPDEPLKLEWLHEADADVEIRIGDLVLPVKQLHDVTVNVKLADGRLEIKRAAAAGKAEGMMDGSLVLEPGAGGYRLQSQISARQLRLDIAGSEIDRTEQPPIDIDINLEAVGSTPHELASSANGAVQLVVGKGVMDSRILDLVTADILLTLLNAFNPFAKQGEATELQCGVALLSIEDGIATLEPMAFQSDKMTLLGDGKIDLRTEKLNLRWITKPRKGIGISASMLTNPYIKLGGTLADPSIELKPLEAVTSTGVAVATAGISLVAKGMFDRITAEKKVCNKALKEIEDRNRAVPEEGERQ